MSKYNLPTLLTTLTFILTLTSCSPQPSPTSTSSSAPTSVTDSTPATSTETAPQSTTTTAPTTSDIAAVHTSQLVFTQNIEPLSASDSSGEQYFKGLIPRSEITFPQDSDVQSKIQSALDDLYKTNKSDADDFDAQSLQNSTEIPAGTGISEYNISIEKMFCQSHAFGFVEKTSASLAGGMHGTDSVKTHTYDMTTGEALCINDILTDENMKMKLSSLFIKNIPEDLSDSFIIDPDAAVRDLINAGDDTAHWYFADDGLHIIFSTYEVARYAAGIVDIAVPYSDLTDIVKPDYIPENNSEPDSTCSIKSVNDIDTSEYKNCFGEMSSSDCIVFSGTVSDIIAKTVSPDEETHENMSVYYANFMCSGNIIYLPGLSGDGEYYELSYTAGKQRHEDQSDHEEHKPDHEGHDDEMCE